jgi:transcriptional regulator
VVEGARGYVSSSVYTHVNVPTYNYQAVHVVGSLELMSSEELMKHLRIVVDRFERDRIAPIDFNAWPQQLLETYCAQIVGFRLVPFRIEGAFKLSQNRNQTDFERIVADLEKGSVEQQQLALAMLKTRT